MKRLKKPTYNQKKIISKKGLEPLDWLIVKETPSFLEVCNKNSGVRRVLEKN